HGMCDLAGDALLVVGSDRDPCLGGHRHVDGLGRALLEGKPELGPHLTVGRVVELVALSDAGSDDALREVPRARASWSAEGEGLALAPCGAVEALQAGDD